MQTERPIDTMSTLLPDFAEMARALRAGKVSSRELTGDCLARIKRHDSSLNSFISVYPEQALAAADAADKAIALSLIHISEPTRPY